LQLDDIAPLTYASGFFIVVALFIRAMVSSFMLGRAESTSAFLFLLEIV